MLIKDLEEEVNKIARKKFRHIAASINKKNPWWIGEELWICNLLEKYPYEFYERSSLVPKKKRKNFGGCIRRSREEGLEEIHSRISDYDKEHNWVYIPEEELWIDNTMKVTKYTVFDDDFLISFLSYIFDKVEMVHPHPDKLIYNVVEEYPVEYHGKYPLIYYSAPSESDLERIAWQGRINKNNNISSSVVSHYGVVSFWDSQTIQHKGEDFLWTNLEEEVDWDNPSIDARIASMLQSRIGNCIGMLSKKPRFDYEFIRLKE